MEVEKLIFELLLGGGIGYLIGSVFITYIWGQIKGIDLTQEGTGQLGATNAGRLLGWPLLIIGGIFDILKAYTALVLIYTVFGLWLKVNYLEIMLASGSIGILIGHIKSIWIWIEKHQWHGGKGGAPLGGILLFYSWQTFLFLYIGLMTLMQIIKKIIAKEKTYENFITNSVVFVCIPPIIFLFTSNIFYFGLILLLEGIIIYSEREKLWSIIKQVKNPPPTK